MSAQGGQALVIFAIFLTVIMGAAALVLDQGLLRKANFDLYNALDAGALAGVSMLKDDPAGAENLAREYVQLNYPGGLPESDVDVDFRCLIGAEGGAARIDRRAHRVRPRPQRELDRRRRHRLRRL